MNNNKEIGQLGEDYAIQFLSDKGYQILDRNWHFGRYEIDIVTLFENTLVFVEVKTRNSDYLVEPELSLTKKQQAYIIKAANAYIDSHDYDLEARFDIISIINSEKGKAIEHIDNAFYPYSK